MSFYYHMRGPQQGKLSFGIKPYSQPFNSLWSVLGDQGDQWNQTSVNIGYDGLQINTTFQFVFEATVGGALSKSVKPYIVFVTVIPCNSNCL